VGSSAIILSRHRDRLKVGNRFTALPQKWGQKMPFGPFLALAAVIVVFCGEAILSSYLRLYFPTS
jgi:leader peptidase (prepilin peptidase) / N-methyltransferase